MAGSSKHGPAVTEIELDKRTRLQAETKQAVNAFKKSVENFRDSIDTSDLFDADDGDRPTSPTIIVNVQKSHRPAVDPKPTVIPPKVESDSMSPEGIKRKVMPLVLKSVAVGTVLGTVVITVLKALGVIK